MTRSYTTSGASDESGTPSPFVTLVSADGFEFHIRRSAACVSGTIRRMLDGQSAFLPFPPNPAKHVHWEIQAFRKWRTDSFLSSLLSGNFSEAVTGVCHLTNLPGIVLEKVVEYFYYNEKHRGSTGVLDMDIPSELCLELVMAADYLET